MADIRLWSKDLISEFLEIYKANPSLWKVKSDDYKNKNFKEISYQKLIKFCHDNGMPQANRDFVVKKIQSLKGSFRKELKKVMNSQRSGSGTDDIYKPNLWYYDLLLFTKDQETPTDSYHNEDEQTEDTIKEGPSTSTNDQQNTSTIVEEQDNLQVKQNTPTVVEEARVEIQNKETGPTPRKRKAAPVASSQAEFLKVCAETMKANSKELTEFDATGINVAKKLAKMDPIQAIYAESLINNVLLKGLLQKLTEETNLCDGCDRRATPSSVHSYMSNYYNTNMPNTYQSFSDTQRSNLETQNLNSETPNLNSELQLEDINQSLLETQRSNLETQNLNSEAQNLNSELQLEDINQSLPETKHQNSDISLRSYYEQQPDNLNLELKL